VLKEEGVFSVSIQDVAGNTLAEKSVAGSAGRRSEIKYFSAPVLLTEIAVGGIEHDLEERTEIDESNKLIGLVRIGVLSEKPGSKEEKILLLGLVSTLVGIIISTLIGYNLSRIITKPILRLNEKVSLLTAGQLETRVNEKSEGEIGALEHGINNMAESLHQSQINLQNRVDEATNSLSVSISELEKSNVKLEKSREEAIKLGDEKVQLLARISHELRTPLNAVIGFSRLLGRKISDHDRSEYTRTIINSATQLTSVIDDVLLFSKLEFGSLSLAYESFNPRETCEDTVAMLSTAAQEKSIELVLLIDKSVPDFMDGDESRIKQVLTNLINNAIKFTDVGEIVVNVSSQFSSSNSGVGNTLSIIVTDTGCGINLKKFGTLFSEFSQVKNIRTRKLDGIGLGLSISRRLARAMGGDITVSSAEGEGSCFCFSIPLLKPSNEKSLVPVCNQLSGKKVLLFEPQLKSRESLLAMFHQFGMEVAVVENEILDCLALKKEEKYPDVLVLAYSADQLESISCEDVADEFGKLFDGPILILTGISLWELEPKMPEKERLLCLSKPLKKETLYRNLLTLLKIENDFNECHTLCVVEPWLMGKSTLIVEDNRFNQILLKTILENRAAEVEIVSNGKDALAVIKDKKFDVIFMDLHMPDADGISISRAIRKGENVNSATPIILVTADVLFDEKTLVSDEVINCVLHKPIHENKLDQFLKNFINDYGYENNTNTKVLVEENNQIHAVSELDEELKKEVLRLCDDVTVSVESNNKKEAKESLHQLLGLSGYYQLKEVSQAVVFLQGVVNSDNKTASLLQLKKIKQLVLG
jgi:two-component system sensor histidine kinase BarA